MKIEKINNNINLSEYDLNNLNNIITFNTHGKYYIKGRTCYYKLQYPIEYDNKNYSYLKIKGCGVLEDNGLFIKPGNKPFIREDGHFGIDKNGRATLEYSSIAPYGGISVSKAINEYNNFMHLHNHNVSSLIPFIVYKYDDIVFNNENLGVSISLCENNKPYRMHKILNRLDLINDDYKEFYKEIFCREFGYNTNLDFKDKSKLINRISYLYGSEIRKFCDSGLYIHSGGWSNIQYSFSSNNVVLIDLDSSRKINDTSLTLLLNSRDLISNIYRLFINLYNPNCIGDYNENIIRETNYISSILEGYFNNIDEEKIKEVSDLINNYYIDNCFNRIKNIESIMLDIPENEVKSYELDIMSFYDYCMKEISALMFEEKKEDKLYLYKRYEGR